MAVASSAYKKALSGESKNKQVLLKIDRVTKKFDETVAVDDVSLSIHQGEIFALLGGSGSGKSTLLRMLAGFERPTEGRIFLDGQDITDMPPYERPINMMFQSYALFPHMTVEQNIAFGLKQDGLPKAEIEERVKEMLGLVQMTQYAKRKPHQLSGGQRQRVALARSLAKRPKLLLLDEPMGALDKLRSQMQLELVQIIERVGVTCVMVTHDQEEAMTMAERIAIMHQGWIARSAARWTSTRRRPVAWSASSSATSTCSRASWWKTWATTRSSPRPGWTIRSMLATASAPVRRTSTSPTPCARKAADRHRAAGTGASGLQLGQGRRARHRLLGGHSVYYIKLPSGGVLQAFMANAERHVKLPTWEEEVYVYWWDDSGVVLQA